MKNIHDIHQLLTEYWNILAQDPRQHSWYLPWTIFMIFTYPGQYSWYLPWTIFMLFTLNNIHVIYPGQYSCYLPWTIFIFTLDNIHDIYLGQYSWYLPYTIFMLFTLDNIHVIYPGQYSWYLLGLDIVPDQWYDMYHDTLQPIFDTCHDTNFVIF